MLTYADVCCAETRPHAAMALKCAYKGWYPKYLQSALQELALPETSGTLLTTGNLQDITIQAGAMTSLGVAGTQFTCFTGTKVHILTQKAERRSESNSVE